MLRLNEQISRNNGNDRNNGNVIKAAFRMFGMYRSRSPESQEDLRQKSPKVLRQEDLRHNSKGELVYNDNVKLLKLKEIHGWDGANGARFEHDKCKAPLVKLAEQNLWTEYAIPPIILNEKNQIMDGNHRYNSADMANNPDFLIPAVYGYGVEWRGSEDIRTIYACLPRTEKFPYPQGISIFRDATILNMSFGELMERSVSKDKIREMGNLTGTDKYVTPKNIFEEKQPRGTAFIEFITKEGNNSSFARFKLENADFTAETWKDFLNSGKLNERWGKQLDSGIDINEFMSKRVKEIINRDSNVNEVEIHITRG